MPLSHITHAGYSLQDYILAPSGTGPLAALWKDKPHRLIYDLVAEITTLAADVKAKKAAV